VRVWVKVNVSSVRPRESGDPEPKVKAWIPGISAFTRVFNALCAGMSGGSVLKRDTLTLMPDNPMAEL